MRKLIVFASAALALAACQQRGSGSQAESPESQQGSASSQTPPDQQRNPQAESAGQAQQGQQPMAQQGTQEGTAAYGMSGNSARGQFVSATQNELVLSSSGSAASDGTSSSGQAQSQVRVPISQDTKVTIDGQPGSVNDIKPGSQVQVTFKESNGQRVASEVTATSGGQQ